MTQSVWSWQLGGVLLLLSATLAVTMVTADRKSENLASPLSSISRNIAGFTGIDDPPFDEHTLHALKPTSYLVRTYTRQDMRVNLFIAFYEQQRAGESMHSPKHCLPGSFPAHWDPKLRIPRGQVVAAASIVSPKY